MQDAAGRFREPVPAMAPRAVIYDCDPGKDDAFALWLALACPDALDVLAVTTVAGNVPLAATSANARRIVEAAGRPDIPVHAGCARPLLRKLVTAEATHGSDGLGGSGLPPPAQPQRETHAIAALIELLDRADEPLTLAAIGPLTNIALLLVARPDLAAKIARLVVMGGSETQGNVTDHAEFNVYVDPHAAQIVFATGLPTTLVTLDVTRDLRPALPWFETMKGFGVPGRALLDMWRARPVALYDVVVTGLLLWPELFDTASCDVSVETVDESRIGMTRIVRGPGPASVVTAIDTDTFYAHILAAMAHLNTTL